MLVGRQRELGVLREALARARSERTPQLVTLVGVPGIGKSRLVVELSQIADAEAGLISWWQGRSLPYGDGVSFWALAEMVKAQAGILEGGSAGGCCAGHRGHGTGLNAGERGCARPGSVLPTVQGWPGPFAIGLPRLPSVVR